MSGKIVNFRIKYLILALEQLVSEALPLTDRMGYISYLREDRGIFYLSHDYPDDTPVNHDLSYYTSNHISLTLPSLSDVAEDMAKTDLSDMIAQITAIDPNSAAFDQYMASLSMNSESELLEQSWLAKIRGESSPSIEAVLRRYQAVTFETPEPVQEINEERTQAWSGSKRGPKPKQDAPKRVEHIQQGKIDALWQHLQNQAPTNEVVYLHTLYSRRTGNTSYGFINRVNKGEGVTRLLKLSEGIGWRDVNTLEYKAYNTIIQVQIAKRLAPLESDPRMVYGIISEEKGREVFRLRLRYKEKAIAKSDGRSTYTGRECHTHDDDVLLDVMWRIRTPLPLPVEFGVPENYNYPTTEAMRLALIYAIASTDYGQAKNQKNQLGELMSWSPEQVYFYYRWATTPSKVTRKTKCGVIRSKMSSEKLLRYMTANNNTSPDSYNPSLVQINSAGQIIANPASPNLMSPFSFTFPASLPSSYPSPPMQLISPSFNMVPSSYYGASSSSANYPPLPLVSSSFSNSYLPSTLMPQPPVPAQFTFPPATSSSALPGPSFTFQ